VGRRLTTTTEWPDTGNRLLYEHLGGALLGQDSAPALRATVDEVVTRAVLAGARERSSPLARTVFRHRAMRELVAAVRARRLRTAGEPGDLLDVVVRAAPPGAPAADLAEVFLSLVFAVVGSVGFALGWSVYLLGTHPDGSVAPSWVLREALRLWPVAWMFARRPAVPHETGGMLLTPRDRVAVCAYLVHRHPAYWSDPSSFRPQRWEQASTQQAFIAFGWGPHACTGAGVTAQLVESLLRVMTDDHRPVVLPHGLSSPVGPALAPPPFALRLVRRRLHRGVERG
jgi:cytochrome P450